MSRRSVVVHWSISLFFRESRLSSDCCKQGFRAQRLRHSKRAAKSLALHSDFYAPNGWVNPGTSPGKCCGLIRNDFAIARDNPQERGFVCAFTAAEARSCGFHTTPN